VLWALCRLCCASRCLGVAGVAGGGKWVGAEILEERGMERGDGGKGEWVIG
jgi:hypothetical protein